MITVTKVIIFFIRFCFGLWSSLAPEVFLFFAKGVSSVLRKEINTVVLKTNASVDVRNGRKYVILHQI